MNHVFVAGLNIHTDTLSCRLQNVAMNGADGREVAMAADNHLKDWRTEEEFDIIFQETFEESEQIGRYLA